MIAALRNNEVNNVSGSKSCRCNSEEADIANAMDQVGMDADKILHVYENTLSSAYFNIVIKIRRSAYDNAKWGDTYHAEDAQSNNECQATCKAILGTKSYSFDHSIYKPI